MNCNEYLKLPYNYIIKPIQDESGAYYHASVLEFDGCQSTGHSLSEAYDSLLEAMEGWIETKLENGFTVPEPIGTEKYSGKFVLRLPESLHKYLAVEAEKEGVSLNQYAISKLAH
ncbi:MAG: type II toxin-antitoxin system HicB family antitoxin [Oscillospiraceae bacterium]|nr:type II toxin-antitoxin system HicB family antitoxin [Oscillospiraceae bacterium]